jgi:hypothetical protein
LTDSSRSSQARVCPPLQEAEAGGLDAPTPERTAYATTEIPGRQFQDAPLFRMTRRQVEARPITREARAMEKRLRDSRKAEAEYESTLDPRQRASAIPSVQNEWGDALQVEA